MISRESLTFRIARLAFVAYTLVAVASCGSGSDSDGSSSAVVTKSESVQSFVGTVSCDAIGGTPQSQAFETRVIFDRAVYRGMSQEVSSAAAIQLGGLAGSVVKGARSQLSATIPASSMFSGSAIDFKVTATPDTGTYAETGRWTVGVDANGKATLKGDSTATLGPVANGWRAACSWNLAEAQAPAGPVSYGHIEKRYGTPPTLSTIAKAASAVPVPKASNGGCGEKWGYVTDGLFVVAAIAAVPTGGASIAAALTIGAVATGVAGDAAGNACLDSQLDVMNQQLAVQAVQIQQIDTYLGAATTAFYRGYQASQEEQVYTYDLLWRQSVQAISPSSSPTFNTGLFGQFMNPNGVGLWNASLQPAAGAPSNPTSLALQDTAYTNARIQVTSDASKFLSNLNNLSGTSFVLPAGGTSTCAPDPSSCVTMDTGTNLIALYQALNNYLYATINLYAPPNQAAGVPGPVNQNIVPLYDQYNATLVGLYTQAVYSMQQAFTMEWMVNQMNYFRATSTTATKLESIGSWGGVPGTHYQYTNQSLQTETNRYNTAQQNLAKLYGARFNQLYQNTLNYIVSDIPVNPPVGTQAYPTTPVSYTFNGVTYTEKPIDYSGQMGKCLTASVADGCPKPLPGNPPLTGPTPLSMVPAVAAGEWSKGAVLYQFSGLKDVAACLASQQAYTASTSNGTIQGWLQTPGACPTIFTLPDGSPLSYTCDTANPPNCKGSVYDGNTLTPYTSYQAATGTTGGSLVLSAPLMNNLKFCDPTTPSLLWESHRPGARLSCGLWYAPKYLGQSFPRANPPAANSEVAYYTSVTGASVFYNDNYIDGDYGQFNFQGAKYDFLTSITGSWPGGAPTSCAFIPTVPPTNGNVPNTPTFTNVRTITGNYSSSNTTQGCTLGWFGGRGTGDINSILFAPRLPRAANNIENGFPVPLRIDLYLQKTLPFTTKVSALFSGAPDDDVATGLVTYGYRCNAVSSTVGQSDSLQCTILDGSVYTIKVIDGANYNGSRLDIILTQRP